MHVWLYGQEWGAVVSVSVEMEEDQLTPTLVGLLSEAGRPGIGCVARIQLRLEPKMPGCWRSAVAKFRCCGRSGSPRRRRDALCCRVAISWSAAGRGEMQLVPLVSVG